tara:strand:- start:55 stop:1503 length:1449 start_codon:yes stop_codon:yes gene_type:complete
MFMVDWANGVTHNYTSDMLEWSSMLVSDTEMWNFWVNEVKDKSYNEVVEVHLNAHPPTGLYEGKFPETFDFTQSTISDLCDGNKSYNNYNWLTVLRNPSKRLISEYYFIKPEWDEYLNAQQFNNQNIKSPINWMANRFWGHLPEDNLFDIEGYIELNHTKNTQVKWLLGKGYLHDYEVTEEDCDKVIDALETLDFKVGIFELLPDTIDYFNDSFGMKMYYDEMPFKRQNKNKPQLDNSMHDKIKENNKWDYKLYNYFLNKLQSRIQNKKRVPELIKQNVYKFGIDHWDEEYIIKTAGDWKSNITDWGRPVSSKIEDTYKKFFEYYKKEGYYNFTKHGITGHDAPPFMNDIKIPKEIQDLELDRSIFFSGNKGTGALPHIHDVAINLLVSGKKRWVLFNTATIEGGKLQEDYYTRYDYKSFIDSNDWFNKEYDTTLMEYKERGGEVYEFIQEAGDVVFIPNNWSHTVLNLEDCLGIVLIKWDY